jgi:hypothetical protein
MSSVFWKLQLKIQRKKTIYHLSFSGNELVFSFMQKNMVS